VVNSKKINIGISIGDPNGIGIEIILKTLSDRTLTKNVILLYTLRRI
jgi:4-hydroxy-L-threonine phosphate dehydrogenase PdxA